jgi:hypothetical protein
LIETSDGKEEVTDRWITQSRGDALGGGDVYKTAAEV